MPKKMCSTRGAALWDITRGPKDNTKNHSPPRDVGFWLSYFDTYKLLCRFNFALYVIWLRARHVHAVGLQAVHWQAAFPIIPPSGPSSVLQLTFEHYYPDEVCHISLLGMLLITAECFVSSFALIGVVYFARMAVPTEASVNILRAPLWHHEYK